MQAALNDLFSNSDRPLEFESWAGIDYTESYTEINEFDQVLRGFRKFNVILSCNMTVLQFMYLWISTHPDSFGSFCIYEGNERVISTHFLKGDTVIPFDHMDPTYTSRLIAEAAGEHSIDTKNYHFYIYLDEKSDVEESNTDSVLSLDDVNEKLADMKLQLGSVPDDIERLVDLAYKAGYRDGSRDASELYGNTI